MKKNILLSLTIVFIIAVTLSGCGGSVNTQRPTPLPDAKTYTISGELTASPIENGKITLRANTNLMDGTLVRFSIESVLGEQLKHEDIIKEGDNLVAEFDISGISQESVYCFLTSTPNLYGDQSKEVFDAYGKNFENLYSDNENNIIWNNKGVILIFSTGEISLK